jgi:hypothetical protein
MTRNPMHMVADIAQVIATSCPGTRPRPSRTKETRNIGAVQPTQTLLRECPFRPQ